jgi:hypothetical protein
MKKGVIAVMWNKDVLAGAAFLKLNSAWENFHKIAAAEQAGNIRSIDTRQLLVTGNSLILEAASDLIKFFEAGGFFRKYLHARKIEECNKIRMAAAQWHTWLSHTLANEPLDRYLESFCEFARRSIETLCSYLPDKNPLYEK